MELTIIGSASAEPNPGAASSCYLLDAGEGQLVMECGHGAAAKLMLYTSIENVGGILISHMHPDHFFDLLPLRYLLAFNGLPRMRLYIPPTGPKVLQGLADVFGEKAGYWDATYDIHVFDPDCALDILGMHITMNPSRHFIPAWGMRIATANSRDDVGYTSDTALTETVESHLTGVHTLLAESSVAAHDTHGGKVGHMTGHDTGVLAKGVGAQRLLLTHYPYYKAEEMLHDAEQCFSGECLLASEGQRYTI